MMGLWKASEPPVGHFDSADARLARVEFDEDSPGSSDADGRRKAVDKGPGAERRAEAPEAASVEVLHREVAGEPAAEGAEEMFDAITEALHAQQDARIKVQDQALAEVLPESLSSSLGLEAEIEELEWQSLGYLGGEIHADADRSTEDALSVLRASGLGGSAGGPAPDPSILVLHEAQPVDSRRGVDGYFLGQQPVTGGVTVGGGGGGGAGAPTPVPTAGRPVELARARVPSPPAPGGPSTPGPQAKRAEDPSAGSKAEGAWAGYGAGAGGDALDLQANAHFGRVRSLGELLSPAGDVFYDDAKDGGFAGGRRESFGLAYGDEADAENDEALRVGGKRVRRALELHAPVDLPADRRAYCDEIIRFCRVLPHETPSAMFFRCWGDNPFELAQLDPLSTFSADVDTASYTLARNYLSRGHMPTKAQIRTEEFVNYFDSGVPAPHEGVFALDLEMAPSRFGANQEWMLRVVLRGKEVDKAERQNLALTFVVDTSGSMKQENRMELVKHALRLLVGELGPADSIAIVAFSNEARQILPMTSASAKGLIETAIYGLQPDGSTNADAGLRMGYEIAGGALTPGSSNRVVLLSDGVANVGNVDQASILASVEHQRSKGIYLNTVGVGMGNHNDALLEQLADKGDGICNYIDTQKEAYRALVENFTGAFQPIARDVKIQVEFNPAEVQSYRLLGYENRTVADKDFRNDAVDAGEIGAGHQVTALYEIVRNPSASNDGPLATARVRFKPPFAIDRAQTGIEAQDAAEKAEEIEKSIAFNQVQTAFAGTTPGYQKAVLVAQLAEFLRRSVHARADAFDALVNESVRLDREVSDEEFTEFCRMVAQNRDLIVRHLPAQDEIAQAIDELTRHNYLKGQLEQLQKELENVTDEVLEQMKNENQELENRIRELIEKHLEASGR